MLLTTVVGLGLTTWPKATPQLHVGNAWFMLSRTNNALMLGFPTLGLAEGHFSPGLVACVNGLHSSKPSVQDLGDTMSLEC